MASSVQERKLLSDFSEYCTQKMNIIIAHLSRSPPSHDRGPRDERNLQQKL